VENELCRPDFIIESSDKKVIIEVMGSHEAEYIKSKAITVPRMKKLGGYVEIDLLDADERGCVAEKLDGLAKNIYRLFLN